MTNRIAAAVREIEAKFPTRDEHRAFFEQLLGDAYAAAMKTDKAVAFVFYGQTHPKPTENFMMQLSVADPTEVLSCVMNTIKLSREAGKITDEQLALLIAKLQAELPPEE